jgi:hypothetical protein
MVRSPRRPLSPACCRTAVGAQPIKPPPTAEDMGHVAAKAKWCIASLARSMGRRAKEDERAEAEARLAIAAADRGHFEISDSLKRSMAGRDGQKGSEAIVDSDGDA